ncbi:ROK family protein [Alicyclobacillus mengziensis]|uniref:ROK family protein n=1 Tax=Alicyclobacillus mengziensis TaxID=2931921 RepID=A0A9X7Z6I6_9BACL|nr:ROK family protein [Alicyclobacillus mengziensis]QSO46411.1 ROK family protein [Alicyclobacillus mengziensis]
MVYTIGIDLGGTKIATAVVDENGDVIAHLEVPTHAKEGPQAVLDRMAETAKRVAQAVPSIQPMAVGVGAPGPLNPKRGIVFGPPNLPGWDHVNLVDELQQRLGLHVVIDNDANAATLAEATLGAGRGYHNLVYITVSTGIGGGVMLDGKVRQGEFGCAAEIGHHIVDINGPLCHCGNRGCLETFASGTAIERTALERMGEPLNASRVALLAREKNVIAQQILDDVYRYLGAGLVNVINLFDPAVIIIGGGVAQIGRPMFEALQQVVNNNHFRSSVGENVQVVPAQLGTKAGVIGAALLPR